jgi:hypothetical protein
MIYDSTTDSYYPNHIHAVVTHPSPYYYNIVSSFLYDVRLTMRSKDSNTVDEETRACL